MGRFLCPYNYAKCEISSYVFVVGCLGITALIVSELGTFLYCFLFFIDYCYRFSMFVNLFMSKSNQYCIESIAVCVLFSSTLALSTGEGI